MFLPCNVSLLERIYSVKFSEFIRYFDRIFSRKTSENRFTNSLRERTNIFVQLERIYMLIDCLIFWWFVGGITFVFVDRIYSLIERIYVLLMEIIRSLHIFCKERIFALRVSLNFFHCINQEHALIKTKYICSTKPIYAQFFFRPHTRSKFNSYGFTNSKDQNIRSI